MIEPAYWRCMRALALALFFTLAGPARAAKFSDFLPGAKPMGMGMAYSAVADDPYALFYNPAGTANTPYIQAGSGLGRFHSPVGPMTVGTLTYLRPFEPVPTATVGAAYLFQRQYHGGDRDAFLFHYAQERRVPELHLTRPVKFGANFKFINVDKGPDVKGKFGLGFDAGILLRSNSGVSGSLALLDLITAVGTPRPMLVMGGAYTWRKWLTAAVDLRSRPGLTEIYPGLEAAFHQGLLKARIGKGLRLDGVSQLAFGFGVNFSPMVLDMAMTLPIGGINRGAGSYQVGLNYRFGAPSFSGSFVGQAASESESLKAEINRLEEQRKSLDAQTKASQTNRDIADGQLRVLERRVRELQDDFRSLQRKKEDLEFQVREAQAEKAAFEPAKPEEPKKPAPPAWPRKHVVQPGDTLRSLAKTYYGDPNLWETIYEANRDKVERGLPQEGATLSIPEPRR